MKKIRKAIISLIVLCFMFNISFAASYEMHTVGEGDTYWTISQNYNTNYYQIMNINGANSDTLFPGELIKVKSLSKTISVYVNNEKLYSDVDPYLENNRSFLPIRTIAEALGAKVSWDAKNKIAIIQKDNTTINLPIGSNSAIVNGKEYILDAPIQLYLSRTMVPVRFISEILDINVSWDQDSYSVLINSSLANIKQEEFNSSTVNDNDVYWLSRIIEAEAQGESYEGKLAVANVVLNRKILQNFQIQFMELFLKNLMDTINLLLLKMGLYIIIHHMKVY